MLNAPLAIVASVSRLRDGGWQRWLEYGLLALLALQAARLFWTLVTPLGPIGPWEPSLPRTPAPAIAVLRESDPFTRAGPAGAVVVTSLDLTLHGVRKGGGRDSAIIATPDGQQRSVAVGDEIVPGVTLSAVAFDHVSLSRGGTIEQLYMDESGPAEIVGGEADASRRTRAPSSPPTGGSPQ